MKVLSLVSPKGGTGKSTLTVNLAAAAPGKVLILDTDPQGTALAWYERREAENPLLARATPGDLPDAISKAEGAGFDRVFIDTAGRDDPGTAAAIRVADFCLVPCRPTLPDMRALPPAVAVIQRLNKPYAFVLSQAPPRGYRIREAERGLAILGPVCPVVIVSRSGYQDAFGLGLSVTEHEADGKAAFELKKLWKWLERRISRDG
jgi:chromosome partitioning protein